MAEGLRSDGGARLGFVQEKDYGLQPWIYDPSVCLFSIIIVKKKTDLEDPGFDRLAGQPRSGRL